MTLRKVRNNYQKYWPQSERPSQFACNKGILWLPTISRHFRNYKNGSLKVSKNFDIWVDRTQLYLVFVLTHIGLNYDKYSLDQTIQKSIYENKNNSYGYFFILICDGSRMIWGSTFRTHCVIAKTFFAVIIACLKFSFISFIITYLAY